MGSQMLYGADLARSLLLHQWVSSSLDCRCLDERQPVLFSCWLALAVLTSPYPGLLTQ